MVMTPSPSPISAEMQRALADHAFQQQPVNAVPGFAHPAVAQMIAQPYSGPTETEAALGAGLKEGTIAALGSWVLLNIGRWGDKVQHLNQEVIDLVTKIPHGELKSIASVFPNVKEAETLLIDCQKAVLGKGTGFMGLWGKIDPQTLLEPLREMRETLTQQIVDAQAHGNPVKPLLEMQKQFDDMINAVTQSGATIQGAAWKNYAIGAIVVVAGVAAAIKAAQHVQQARQEHAALQATAEGLRRDFEQQYIEGAAQGMMLEATQAEVEALSTAVQKPADHAVIDKIAQTNTLAPTTSTAAVAPIHSHDDSIFKQLSPSVAQVVEQVAHESDKKNVAPDTKVTEIKQAQPMIALPATQEVGIASAASDIIRKDDPAMSMAERQEARRLATPETGMKVGG